MLLRIFFSFHFIFIFSFASIFSDQVDPFILATTEGEPGILVAGIVDPISGSCCVAQEDIRVEGVVPIVISHAYVKDMPGKHSKWKLLPHLVLYFESMQTYDESNALIADETHLIVHEPSGSRLCFKRKGLKWGAEFIPAFIEDGSGVTNTAHGIISARSNLKNYKIRTEYKRFILSLPNGGERIYKLERRHDDEEAYYLEQERLPSGSYYKYKYDKNHRLIEIQATNPEQTKIYSWIKFHYFDKNKPRDCNIETSDGQHLSYRFHKERDHHVLTDIFGSSRPKLHYDHKNEELHCQTSESGNYLEFSYYHEKDNHLDDIHVKVDKHDPRIGRIRSILAPNGEGDQKIQLYRFVYRVEGKHQNNRWLQKITDVFDPLRNRTTYFYDDHGHPTKVEYFEQRAHGEILLAEQRFSYGSGQPHGQGELVCKSWLDKITGNHIARTFSYDSRGNVLEERLWGNLSGRSPAPLTLDDNNRPIANGCESYAKHYTYDDKDRIIQCEEDNGRKTTFAYLHDTDLPTAHLTYAHDKLCKRTFSIYNDDRNLIGIIEDDGCKPAIDDLTGVTERHIRRFELREEMPAFGLPAVIREYYLDLASQKEVLLSKKVQQYSSHGKVCREDHYTDENTLSHTLQVTYDAQKRVLEEQDALGQATRYNYTPEGLKIQEVSSGSAQVLDFQYDLAGRLIKKRLTTFDNIEQTLLCRYNSLGHLTATTDSNGFTTFIQPDSRGKPLHVTLPPNEGGTPILTSIYDSRGRPIANTDAENHTTKITYNALGQIIHIEHPDGSSEHKTYTFDGLLHETIDQEGLRTTSDYDGLDHIIATRISDCDNHVLAQEQSTFSTFHLLSRTDPAGNTTHFTYDFAGRKIGEQAALATTFSYDERGRLNKTEQGETIVLSSYDFLNRLIEEKVEDRAGHLLSHKKLVHDGADRLLETHIWDQTWIVQEATLYDGLGRVLQKIDASGRVHHITYNDHYRDTQGREVLQIIATDPLGIRTVKTHNPLGHLVKEETLNTSGKQLACTEYRYDNNGRRIAETATVIAPSASGKIATLHSYDSMGRLIQLAEAEGTALHRITRYSYTARGLLARTLKPDGVTLISQYDPLGRCIRQFSSDNTIDYTYHYNELNLPTLVEDAVTASRSLRSYDPWGRLIHEELATGLVISATFDALGRRAAFTLPDNSAIHYTYDHARLSAISRTDSKGATLYTHRYLQYTARSQLASEELIHNLGQQSYGYDHDGRLVGSASPYYWQKILSCDAAGHVTSTLSDKVQRFYTYDDLGHMSREYGPSDHAYSYDSLHNRRMKDFDACTINDLNQLLSCSRRQYQYDLSGNPLSKTSDTGSIQYRYDALGRLIAIEKKNSWRIHYAYDAWHRRLHASTSTYTWGAWQDSTQEFFLWDGDLEIGSCDAQGTITELRVLGHGFGAEIASAVAIELDGTAYAPIHDVFGNVQKLINPKGRIFESYTYTAFGEEPSIIHRNPWRFASKRHDKLTGLIYFGRRYYSPEEGRWLTPDPSGLDQGPNLYAFVLNNPLHHLDLFGLQEEDYFSKVVYDRRAPPSALMEGISIILVSFMNFVGSFIEAVGQHIIPDYLGGIPCRFVGQIFQDQYPHPLADKCQTITVGQGELSPNERLAHTNGIGNLLCDAKASGEYISRKHGGCNVHVVYNPTRGILFDLFGALFKKGGYSPEPVQQQINLWKELFATMGSEGRIRQYAHSEGGLVVDLALQRMSAEERNKITVYTFGSASLFSSKLAEVTHHVSKRDIVPMTDVVEYTRALFCKDTNVQFVGSTMGIPLIDHGIMVKRYRGQIKRLGKEFTARNESVR